VCVGCFRCGFVEFHVFFTFFFFFFFRSLVVLAVFVCGALAQSTCYGVTTTCVITNACNTCFPNPAGCTASYDPVTDITTLTTTSFQDYTIGGAVTGTFSYPAGVVVSLQNCLLVFSSVKRSFLFHSLCFAMTSVSARRPCLSVCRRCARICRPALR
jgi:hypothetical protein